MEKGANRDILYIEHTSSVTLESLAVRRQIDRQRKKERKFL